MMPRPTVSSVICALVLLSCVTAASAGESRIELTDGSLVIGELVSIEDGRYRVRSSTLGELWIPETRIRSFRPLDSEDADRARSPLAAGDRNQRQSIQRQIGENPALMGQVMALQNDPEIQAILADPQLLRRILAGDLESLQQDPRILRLMDNPSIRAIVGDLEVPESEGRAR